MSHELLKQISIPVPCPEPWSGMLGDHRKRFCQRCEKNVYNLSALSSDEVAAFLLSLPAAPCVRFYRRPDGRVLTSDCRASWNRAFEQARTVILPRSIERHSSKLVRIAIGGIIPVVALVVFLTICSQNIRALFAPSAGELAGNAAPDEQTSSQDRGARPEVEPTSGDSSERMLKRPERDPFQP